MICLIVPVFNESLRWDREYFLDISSLENIDLLVVNDGSTDNSLELINEIIELRPNVSVLNLRENSGKAEAVRLGFLQVMTNPNYSIVGILDSDGAFSHEDISRISKLAMIEVNSYEQKWWWSSRIKLAGSKIKRTRFRHAVGRIIATLLDSRNHPLPYDTQAGFKLFKIDTVMNSILQDHFRTRWFMDLEMYYRYRITSGDFPNLQEVALLEWNEIPDSKLSMSDTLLVLKELAVIKSLQRNI